MALNGLCYLTPPTQFSVNLFLETTTVQSTTLVPTTTQMSTAKSTTPETTTTTTPEATTFTSSTTLIKSNTFWFEHGIFYCKDILIPIYNHVSYECFRSIHATIKHTQDGLSLRLLSLIHISIPKVYILGLFYCHSCLLNRLDILIQLIHKCLTFNIIHPHVKALLNNIFTSKSLTCMALDAITVFGKV